MNFDSTRKALFDKSAESYDKYRPSYPDQLAEDVVALSSLTEESLLLEIGSGTGKATELFAERDFHIDCVEPGVQLAEIARQNFRDRPKVKIHVSEFEGLQFTPKSYDLLFSAQAYHWIDPAKRMDLAAGALKRGGSFVLMYNYSPKSDDPIFLELSKRIAGEANGAMEESWDYSADISRWTKEITECGHFGKLFVDHYPWKRVFSSTEYAGLFHTFSDFLKLPDEMQGRLSRAMIDFIDEHGGRIEKPYDCVLFHAVAIA